jgi:hypothetical protein
MSYTNSSSYFSLAGRSSVGSLMFSSLCPDRKLPFRVNLCFEHSDTLQENEANFNWCHDRENEKNTCICVHKFNAHLEFKKLKSFFSKLLLIFMEQKTLFCLL